MLVFLLDELEDGGGGHVLDVGLFGGILGGEVVVGFEGVDVDAPGMIGCGALVVEVQEFGEVGIGDGLVLRELFGGFAFVVPGFGGAAAAVEEDDVGFDTGIGQEDACGQT